MYRFQVNNFLNLQKKQLKNYKKASLRTHIDYLGKAILIDEKTVIDLVHN